MNKANLFVHKAKGSEYLYVHVKGKVKIFTNSAEGKTLILSFKTPLEVIGDLEYVQGINFINTVEAVSAVCMIGIHHRWLKKYGSDHAPLLTIFVGNHYEEVLS